MLGYRMVPLLNSWNFWCLCPFIHSFIHAYMHSFNEFIREHWLRPSLLDSGQALRTGTGNLSWTRLRPSLPETLKRRSDQNTHNSARYKADGGQHGEEGEINSNWRVEWRTLHQRSNKGDLTGGLVVKTPCGRGKKKKSPKIQQWTSQRQTNLPCRQGLRQSAHNSLHRHPPVSHPLRSNGRKGSELSSRENSKAASHFILKIHTKFEFHSTGY